MKRIIINTRSVVFSAVCLLTLLFSLNTVWGAGETLTAKGCVIKLGDSTCQAEVILNADPGQDFTLGYENSEALRDLNGPTIKSFRDIFTNNTPGLDKTSRVYNNLVMNGFYNSSTQNESYLFVRTLINDNNRDFIPYGVTTYKVRSGDNQFSGSPTGEVVATANAKATCESGSVWTLFTYSGGNVGNNFATEGKYVCAKRLTSTSANASTQVVKPEGWWENDPKFGALDGFCRDGQKWSPNISRYPDGGKDTRGKVTYACENPAGTTNSSSNNTSSNPTTTTNTNTSTNTSGSNRIVITPTFVEVYNNPSTTGFVGYQAKGQGGVIVEGPVTVGSDKWYKIDFDFGADGWMLQKANVSASTDTTAFISSQSGLFTRDLSVGMEGDDVKALQQFLNQNGFTVAYSGAGSSGNETTYYGEATASAVARFQNQYASEVLAPIGLSNGSGYFGELTRAQISKLKGPIFYTKPVEPINSNTTSATLESLLKQVQALQTKLMQMTN